MPKKIEKVKNIAMVDAYNFPYFVVNVFINIIPRLLAQVMQ